jgi:hypothetical protein
MINPHWMQEKILQNVFESPAAFCKCIQGQNRCSWASEDGSRQCIKKVVKTIGAQTHMVI